MEDKKKGRKWLRTLFPQFFFDAYNFPQKYAVIVLFFIILVTIALGLFFIKHTEFYVSLPQKRPSLPVHSPFLSTQIDLRAPTAMVAGFDDTFFVAVGTTVHRYRINYVNESSIFVELLWNRNFKSNITALHYVTGNAKAIRGMLLVAMGNKIELVNPDQNEGSGTHFVELEGMLRITSLATGPNAVFAADSSNGTVLRFDMLGNKNMIIGQPDDQTGFHGIDMENAPQLSVAYLPEEDLIAVTNPQQFRVEFFHNDTGAWDSDLSWDKKPQTEDGFYPGGNPVYIEALPDESLLTVEKGDLSRISNFLLNGTKRFEFDYPLLKNFSLSLSRETEHPLVSTGYTKQKQSALLLLSKSGFFQIYVVPSVLE